MGYSNAGAELLLPEVDDVDIMSDSELEQISHEVFRLLPGTPKRVFLEGCIQEEARDSIIVVNFLKHSYRNKYFGKIDNLEEILCRVLDPKNRGLVRQTVFAEGFPFILRLVQRIDQALKEKQERMIFQEQMIFREQKLDHLVPSHTGEDQVKRGGHGTRRASTMAFANPLDSPQALRKPSRKSCSGIPNLERTTNGFRSLSLSDRRRGAPDTNKQTMQALQIKIHEEGESFFKCRMQGLRCMLKEADPNGTGIITWNQLRQTVPGLPEEPSIDIDPEQGVDISLLIRILYPQEVASLLLKHYSDENTYGKQFVLPEEKRQEIADLFCFMSGGIERDAMEPVTLYLGLRQVLELDTRETAIAFFHLIVQQPRLADDVGDADLHHVGPVTLQHFTKWYSDHMLTDSFKNDHLHA